MDNVLSNLIYPDIKKNLRYKNLKIRNTSIFNYMIINSDFLYSCNRT